jgi:dipeptidyl-peptidase-3
VSEEEWTYALEYGAQVVSIFVNYKSFGFSKFIPRVGRTEFRKIVESSPQAKEALPIWDKVRIGHQLNAKTLIANYEAL